MIHPDATFSVSAAVCTDPCMSLLYLHNECLDSKQFFFLVAIKSHIYNVWRALLEEKKKFGHTILFDQRINCGKHVKCTVSKTGSCSPTRGFVKLKSSSKELDSKSYILVSVSFYLYLNHAYRKVMTNTNTVEWHWKPPYYEIIPKRIV